MTAALSHFFGLQHLEFVEDVVQETFYAALKTWPTRFPPDPRAWLFKVAKNKAINLIKRNHHIRDHLLNKYWNLHHTNNFFGIMDSAFDEGVIHDNQFRLLIAGSHATVNSRNQIIFILKTIGGFGASEIASALIMNPEAVSKNYQRTVKTIKERGIGLEDVSVHETRKKLDLVHKIIYLLFNEGYKASSGSRLLKEELCFEAIRLAKVLLRAHCFNPATNALLSLMYFNLARFRSRVGQVGELILLKDQDRKLWDQKLISAGFQYLSASMKGESLVSFHIEAAIASLHCISPDYESTDWQKLLFYHDKLIVLNPSPVAHLNRIVVLKMIKGAGFALKQLLENEHLQSQKKSYLYFAVKGQLLEEQQAFSAAIEDYEAALSLAENQSEKKFLSQTLERCKISARAGNR